MSSVQHLREFISARLTAAAEEIFTEFEKTIVQYEEEIDRQRRLLDVTWKPHTHLKPADLPKEHDFKEEEVLADPDRSSSLDQEKPEPAQIKEEPEEPCSSQEEELVVKQESDAFKVTVTFDESDPSEGEPSRDQLLFQNSPEDEIQDNNEDASSNGNELPQEADTQGDGVDACPMSEGPCGPDSGRKSAKCHICSKVISFKSGLKKHHRIHTGEKPYSCKTCGKSFNQTNHLTAHMRSHTDEKPYPCQMCHKRFRRSETLLVHMRTHTGEKLYSCQVCGKSFTQNGTLTIHMRSHTGEKPYPCQACGKRFKRSYSLLIHTRTHTGEKLYSCQVCGKKFSVSHHLTGHMRSHTGEKPYCCRLCGKRYKRGESLVAHMRTHTDERLRFSPT